MSAETAWKVAREAAAECAAPREVHDATPEYSDGYCHGAEDVAADLRTLPMPPAFASAVEAEMGEVVEEAEELRDIAEELAGQVEAWARAHYGWPNVDPALQDNFERDMSAVVCFRANFLSRMEGKL